MTTGHLRLEAPAARLALGRWLRAQTAAIAPAWIASVRARPHVQFRGFPAPPVDEQVLQAVYDGLVTAFEVGRYDDLDRAGNSLAATHMPVGYGLGDLLGAVTLLRENLWLAITAAFDAQAALQHLHGTDVLLTRLVSQVSQCFLTEKEEAMRDELEHLRWQLDNLGRQLRP